MNLVEIVVRVKDDAVAIGKIKGVQNAFKGLGLAATAALGVGMATPLAAAGVALGAFVAVALPTIDKVKKALTSTGAAGQKAWAALSPAQTELAHDIQGVQKQFDQLQQAMAPVVSKVLDLAVKVGGNLIPALGTMAKGGASVITGFLRPFNTLIQSPFFDKFSQSVSNLASQFGPLLGKALTSIIKSLMQLIVQVGPAAIQIFKSLLPVISNIVSGLVPFISMVTKAVAAFLMWIDKYPALKAAIIGIGLAIGIALAAGSDGILPLIGLIAALIGWLVHLWQTSQTFRNVVTSAFSAVADAVLRAAHIMLDIWHVEADAILSLASTILHALALIPGPTQHAMQTAAKAVDGFKQNVDQAFNGAIAKIDDWRHTVDNMPKVVKLEGNISDLQSKLATAKKQLQDPNLTATRRARVAADISNLESQLARARAALAAINGDYATTYVYVQTSPIRGPHRETGGITGAASGGVRGNLVEVGEHGRELVRLPVGSTVFSNPDSERMLSQMGSGGSGRVVLEIRGGGGEFEDFMAKWMRKFVRVYGQGSVQTAFGS